MASTNEEIADEADRSLLRLFARRGGQDAEVVLTRLLLDSHDREHAQDRHAVLLCRAGPELRWPSLGFPPWRVAAS